MARWVAIALVGATWLLSLGFSGIIYAWDDMQVIMEREGMYCETGCPNGHNATYNALRYNVIISVAEALAAGSGIVTGAFLDWFGPGATVAMCGVFMVAGSLLNAFRISYILGFALYAVGGMAVLISGFRIASIFPSHANLVISVHSCLFDASTVVFVIFEALNEFAHVELKWLFVGYGALCAIAFSFATLLWYASPSHNTSNRQAAQAKTLGKEASGGSRTDGSTPVKPDILGSLNDSGLSPSSPGFSKRRSFGPETASPQRKDQHPLERMLLRNFSRLSGDDFEGPLKEALLDFKGPGSDEDVHSQADLDLVSLPSRMHLMSDGESDAPTLERLVRPPAEYVPVAARSFTDQLLSFEFTYIFIFTVVHMFRTNLFLSMSHQHMESLGDHEHNNYYSKIVGVVLPLGFISAPAVGWLMSKHGFAVTSHVVNILGAAYGAFEIVPHLWAQPIAAAFFTAYRALLFSYVAAFTIVVFGPTSVGRMTGILYSVGAVFIVLQMVIVKEVKQGPQYQYLRAGSLAALILPIIVTLWVQRVSEEVGPPKPTVIELASDEDDQGPARAKAQGASANAAKLPPPKYESPKLMSAPVPTRPMRQLNAPQSAYGFANTPRSMPLSTPPANPIFGPGFDPDAGVHGLPHSMQSTESKGSGDTTGATRPGLPRVLSGPLHELDSGLPATTNPKIWKDHSMYSFTSKGSRLEDTFSDDGSSYKWFS